MRPWLYFLPLLSFAFLLWRVVFGEQLVFDDAYMFMRYASNWLNGDGFTWNAGEEPIYGCTSLAHLFVLTGLKAVFSEVANRSILVYTTITTGILCIAALILVGSRMAKGSWLSHKGLLAFFIVPYLCLNPLFWFHVTTGMETVLSFLFLVMLMGLLSELKENVGWMRLLGLAFCAYFCFLIRPDNGIYAGLLPVLWLFLLPMNENHQMNWRLRAKNVLLFGLIFGGFLLLDTMLKIQVFGYPLPLSFFAKQNDFYEGYVGGYQWNPIRFLYQFLIINFPAILLIILTSSSRTWRLNAVIGIPILLTFAYFFTVMQIMGGGARYYFPASGFITLWAIASLLKTDFVQYESLSGSLWFRVRAFVGSLWDMKRLAIVLFLGILAIVLNPMLVDAYGDLLAEKDWMEEMEGGVSSSNLPELNWWDAADGVHEICSELPAGTWVAASEYGMMAAENMQVHVLDLVGLHDEEIAMNGFSAAYIMEREPELIWFPHFHYTKMVRALIEHPDFERKYVYRAGAFAYGIAVRRDAPEVERIVAQQFEEAYGLSWANN